jgi:hypothetical protein
MAQFGSMTVPQNVPIAVDFGPGSCLNIRASETIAFALKESDFTSANLAFNPTLPADITLQLTGNIPGRIWFYTFAGGGATVNYWFN